MTRWLNKLEYKFRGFGIDNLMLYITGTMLAVYIAEGVTGLPISGLLSLDRGLLFKGQIWRLVTFIFEPPHNSIIWVFFTLYMYYFFGSSLENAWGKAKFMIFYVFGVVGAIIAALITGYASNMYLNLSIFLAFAILFPNYELLLFFIVPIKVKWLAYLDAAFLLFSLILGDWHTRVAVIASLLNIILFFNDILVDKLKNWKRYGRQRHNFKKSIRRDKDIYGN